MRSEDGAEVDQAQLHAPVLHALPQHVQGAVLLDLLGDAQAEVAVGVGAVLLVQPVVLVRLRVLEEADQLVGEEDEVAVVGGGGEEPVAGGDEAVGDVRLEVLLLVGRRAHAARPESGDSAPAESRTSILPVTTSEMREARSSRSASISFFPSQADLPLSVTDE